MVMNAEELSKIMPANALIASWGAAELQDLLERAQLCPMKKGDVLLHQGDGGDYLIILLDGTELARLMIQYGVGARTERVVDIKRLDMDYFDEGET